MFTRIIFCLALMGSASTMLSAQLLEWIFLDAGEGCLTEQTDCANNEQCYALLYTPSLTGTATSYTLGFLANCVGGSSASLRGESCTMPDNTDILTACGANLIQILPSGNSGTLAITENVPVILHQVCVTLPPGTSMTFNEDESLSLTVSVDLSGGGAATDNLMYTAFTASSADCGGTLPVTWQSFTARQRDKGAQLDWSTSEEVGHDRFVVEWGTNGRDFAPLATVYDADNSTPSANHYGYYHPNPAAGVNYYRLRQIDLSGEYSFSTVESLRFSGDDQEVFFLAPNPASDRVRVSFAAEEPSPVVRLYAANGQLIRSIPTNDRRWVDVPLADLPNGIYLVRAGKQSKRLVKR